MVSSFLGGYLVVVSDDKPRAGLRSMGVTSVTGFRCRFVKTVGEACMDSLSESLDELDVQKSAGHLAVIHLRSGGTAARYQHRGEPLLGRSDLVAGVLERVPVDLARLPIHVRLHHRARPCRIGRFHITTLGVGAGVSLPALRPEHFELVEHGGARGLAGALPEREPEATERVEEHRLERDVALLAPLLEARAPPLHDSEPPLGIARL